MRCGDDQKVQGGSGDTLHLVMIGKHIESGFPQEQLEENASDHTKGKQGQTLHDMKFPERCRSHAVCQDQ